MTRKEELAKIAHELMDHMGYLWSRWQDEKEFEDFQTFIDTMKPKFDARGLRFKKMTKRPFRVVFVVQGVDCFIKVTSKEFTWGVMASASHK